MISDGEVTDVTALTDALRDFFKSKGLPKRVRLGIALGDDLAEEVVDSVRWCE